MTRAAEYRSTLKPGHWMDAVGAIWRTSPDGPVRVDDPRARAEAFSRHDVEHLNSLAAWNGEPWAHMADELRTILDRGARRGG